MEEQGPPLCPVSRGCMALAHEGRLACFVPPQEERKVVIWDFQAEDACQTVDASAPVQCLEVSERRSLLFVGLASGTVLVFPLDSGQDVGCVLPPEHPKPITALALAQRGDELAVACEDRVRVLEVGQGSTGTLLLSQPAYAFGTHAPGAAISSLALLSGSRVLYGVASGQLFLYLCPQDCLVVLESPSTSSITCLRTSHGEKWVLSGSVSTPLRCLWDVERGCWQHQMLFQKHDSFSSGLLCACFSKDDRFLFTASMDQCVTVWDISQGVLLAVQSVQATIIRMEPTAHGFVAATRLGRLIQERFFSAPSVVPQRDLLRSINATCRVTSRRREAAEEDPGGEARDQGRGRRQRQGCGNKLSQICRIV